MSYRLAVAIRKLGYSKVWIYNDGLKGWEKAGREIVQQEPLPLYTVRQITSKDLNEKVFDAEETECRKDGKEMFVVLDLRSERTVEEDRPVPMLATNCRTISGALDDLMDKEFRNQIPRNIPVYSITETGARDSIISRYLNKFGYTNISGLKDGMRGWIKNDYPVYLHYQ